MQPRDAAKSRLQAGISALERDDFGEALELLTAAINADQTFSDAFFYLGLLYEKLEDFPLAQRYFIEALQKDPANEEARRHLSVTGGHTTEDVLGEQFATGATQTASPKKPSKIWSKGLVEIVETAESDVDYVRRGTRFIHRIIDSGAKALVTATPAVAAGIIAGGIMDGLGLVPFLPATLGITTLVLLVQSIQRRI